MFDGRFDSAKVGKGNEFRVAVQSCYDNHPEIPIYLITNVKYLDKDIRKMIFRVYELDLMKESGLDKLVKKQKILNLDLVRKLIV